MPIKLSDALNLLPKSIRDDRGQHFIKIVYLMCCELDQLNPADFPLPLIPYKLKQFGLGSIAGIAGSLPASNQRQLLSEAVTLQSQFGTPRATKRILELFGYPGTTLEENPTIGGVKRWGEFGVTMQQIFNYADVEVIVNATKPLSRKVIYIRFVSAVTLNGAVPLNGSSALGGLPGGETPPIQWQDASTALNPVPSTALVPDLTNASTNLNTNFNQQLQALINQIRFEDNALSTLATRVNVLNTRLSDLNGGTIAPQLASISANILTLNNSNQTLLNVLNQVDPLVTNLKTKTDNLESQTTTIANESSARQLDSTVQRKNPSLEAIAALVPSTTFPTSKVLATDSNNTIILDNPPNLGAFIPEVANLEFKQVAGTHAGNYPTADVWAAMPFTVASNDNTFLTAISATRFTIPKGTYLIKYDWIGCGCLGFGGRIWNVTSGAILEAGSPGLTVSGGGGVGDTWSAEGCLYSMFSIASPLDIEFQFRAKILHPSGAALTAGQSNSNAIEQLYQEVVILRMFN